MGAFVVCECMWSSLKAPPLVCDSSSIRVRVRRAGRAAVLLVIASEMNYLAKSVAEGVGEIVIELPPSLPPSPLCLKLLHLQCRKPFSVRI